jgi:hypothetical protein
MARRGMAGRGQRSVMTLAVMRAAASDGFTHSVADPAGVGDRRVDHVRGDSEPGQLAAADIV